MFPCPAEASIAERNQDANCQHARIAGGGILDRRIDEGAQSRIAVIHEVYEVLRYGVQAGGQRLVLDDSLKLDARFRRLPRNGVTGFDIEIDEEECGDGRQIWQAAGTGALGQPYVKLRLATT